MQQRKIFITEYDLKRLRELIAEHRHTEPRNREYLENLENELARATHVEPKDVPPDVVTMNSKVCLEDLETGEEIILTLVFPEDADRTQSKISVLAPLGTAVLGYRAGDTFSWKVPAGVVSYRVKELLFQPEASGNYDL